MIYIVTNWSRKWVKEDQLVELTESVNKDSKALKEMGFTVSLTAALKAAHREAQM